VVGKQSRSGRKQGAKVLFCAVNAVTGHPAGSVAVHPVVNSSRPSAGIVDIASITESCISVAPPVLPSKDDFRPSAFDTTCCNALSRQPRVVRKFRSVGSTVG